MDVLLDKLKKNTILTKEDILLLKKSIHQSHPHLDSSSKAHLLAKSIHNMLNEGLTGFTKDYKHDIKMHLIRNTLLRNKDSICQYDVVKACASSQDTSLEFIYQVNKWVGKQTNEEIGLSLIKNTLREIDIDGEEYNYDEISLSSVFEENDADHNTDEPDSHGLIPDTVASVHSPKPMDSSDSLDNTDSMDHAYFLDIEAPPDEEDFLNPQEPLDSEKLEDIQDTLDTDDTSEQRDKSPGTLKEYMTLLKNIVLAVIPVNIPREKSKKYILIYSLIIGLLIIPITHIVDSSCKESNLVEVVSSIEYDDKSLNFEKSNDIVISEEAILLTSHLPDYLKYKPINEQALKNYLIERNSLLSSDPYFSIIISCAGEFNINPLLLFSIAGHEQSFVPKNHKRAKEIVNNPYNVFQSWQKYNTDIGDSSRIACRTIINHLKGRPDKEDPFKWINRRYAEDKNWWKGVKKIYNMLEAKASVGQ